MYDIYIKNYDDANGEYQTAETLMFSVPMEPGEPNAVIDPKVNGEMGKAGSFEFSMNIGHPYYNSLRQMVTIFRVEYDGDTIFRGRVLTIDVGHLDGTKSVHCEGDYAFLLDTVAKGIPDDERKNTNALDYLTTLIDEHNKQVGEGSPDKMMYIGAVPGWYDQAAKNGGFVPDVYQCVNTDPAYKYGKNSWRETQQAVNELADSFGGFFRTRYVKNQNGTGKVYLDWLDGYFRTEIVPQTIEVGENLVSISSSAEVNNIFTALIPVGKAKGKNIFIDGYQTGIHGDNKRILVPDICKVLSDAQLNYGYHSKQDYQEAVAKYGIIYRVQTFDNADTQAALWTYAIDWIWNNYHGGLESFSIGALDMHVLGESSGKFLVGDRVNVVYPDVNRHDTDPEARLTKLMTVMRATYVLYNPEKNTYEIGIPNAILKRKYGDKKSSSTSKKSSKASKKAAEAEEAQELKNTEKETFDSEVDALLWQFVQSASRNSSEYNEYKQKYGDKAASAIQKTAYLTLQNNITDTGSATDIVNTRHKIVLDANKQTISMVGPANVKLPEQAAAVKEVVKMSLDGMTNKLTFKEIMDAEKEYGWWRPDGAARTIMELGANPAGGSIVLSKVKDKSETTEGTVVPTTLLDGLKGLAGTNLTLGLFDQAGNFTESVKDLVDKTGSDALTQVKAAVKIKGQEAKIEAGTNTEVKVEIAGQTGTAGVGKKQNGSWQVFLNDTVTYKDKSNQNKTVSGFVSAEDFKVGTSVNSLSTELLVVRDLIADKITANTVISTAAQIEDLVGQKASITDLESATTRIGTLEGDVANIKKITAQSITADTYVSADIGKFNQLYVSNSGKKGQPVGISGDMTIDGNLTIKIDERDYVNLKNALSNISSGGFNDGKLTVKQQKMDGTFGTDLTFDVTQTDWYADVVLGAQNAGIASAKISKWNDLTKSIRYENGKLKLIHHVEAIRKDTVLNENDEYDDVTIGTVSGVSNPNDFALEITDTHGSGLAYDTGWSDAFGKVSLPDKQPTGTWPSSISISTPKSKWNTQADSTTYSLEVGSWNTLDNTVYVNLFNNTSQKNVARKQVNASTIVNTAVTTATENGRKAGWTAAYGKVSLPSTQSNTGSMVVKTPAETEDTTPNPVSTTYTLEQDDNWGSNNKKYVYIQNGTSEKNVARIQVDASTIVSKAETNATNVANAAVTLTGSWSNGKYTVTNSANDKKASTKLENIALNGNLSSSNGKLYAPLKVNILDDNEDEVAVFTQNSLQLGSVSWTNKTITNASGSSSVEAEVSIGNVVLTHSYAGTYAAADSDNEAVRAAGWAAAFDKVSLPSTEPVSNWPSKVTIGTPKSTENATADTTDYFLAKGSWSNNKMYVYITNGTNHANVARTEVDASQLVNGVSLTELTIPAANLSYASSKLSITPKYKLSTMTAAANWSSAIEVPWYTKVGISGGTKTYTPTNQTAYYDTPLVVSAKAGTSSNPADEVDSATYALASTAVPVLNSSDARLYTKSRATIAGTEYSCRLWQIGSIEVSAKIVPKTGTTDTATDSFSITAKAKDQATNPNTLAIASKTLSISGKNISMSTTTGATTVQVLDGTTVLAEKTINATYTGNTGAYSSMNVTKVAYGSASIALSDNLYNITANQNITLGDGTVDTSHPLKFPWYTTLIKTPTAMGETASETGSIALKVKEGSSETVNQQFEVASDSVGVTLAFKENAGNIGNFTDANTLKTATIQAKVGSTVIAEKDVTATFTGSTDGTASFQQLQATNWSQAATSWVDIPAGTRTVTISSTNTLPYKFNMFRVLLNGSVTHDITVQYEGQAAGTYGVGQVSANGEYTASQLGYNYLTGVNVQVASTVTSVATIESAPAGTNSYTPVAFSNTVATKAAPFNLRITDANGYRFIIVTGGSSNPATHSITVAESGSDISSNSSGTYLDKSGNVVTVDATYNVKLGHNKRFEIKCGTATYYILVSGVS